MVHTAETKPLEGLRVVEGSAFVAAPLGGMTLAQLGADVIRFDTIGGGLDYHRWPCTPDGVSLFWASMNKGKRSFVADLRSREGQELVAQLVTAPGDDRGIFLSNFPEAGWLADTALRARRPDLIYVNVLGNPDGSTAVDYTVNPSSGFAHATGPAGGVLPTNHVLPAWDMATGLHAAVGVLAAERMRTRRGGGQLITVSLADVAFAMVSNLGFLAQVQVLGEDRPPIGNDMYGAFGRDFPTSDQRRVMVVAISLRQWRSLARATGIEEHLPAIERAFGVDLSLEGDRFHARDALAALIGGWIGRHTLAEVSTTFDEHEVCWGPYQTFRQLLESDWRCSPQNPLFADIEQPGIGRLRVAGSPLDFSSVPRETPSPAPMLGEHTEAILADEMGLSTLEIGRLQDAGTISLRVTCSGRCRTVIVTLEDLALEPEITCLIDVGRARQLRTAVGIGPELSDGAPLPILWQWAYFTPTTPTEDLGGDGHPMVGGPLRSFPRRMWAGGETIIERPLILGRPARRRTAVVGSKATTGRSGDLVIVTLEHRYEQDGSDALSEQQTLVYRSAGSPEALPLQGSSPDPGGGWMARHDVDERILFRFSAATFNTHRIHYDRRYAAENEGYPDLVIHGPLTAMLLAGDIARHHGSLRSFRFRASAPLYASQPFWSQGQPGGTCIAARVVRADGVVAMEATADLHAAGPS